MPKLSNTPLHRKIQRAFPHTDFPARAIALLEMFDEMEPIHPDEVGTEEAAILHDLAGDIRVLKIAFALIVIAFILIPAILKML